MNRFILALAGVLVAVLMAPAAEPTSKAKAALALAPVKSACPCNCGCADGDCDCVHCQCPSCPGALAWHLCKDGRYHLFMGNVYQNASRAPMPGEAGYKPPVQACRS